MDTDRARCFITKQGTALEQAEGLWVLDRRPPDPKVVEAFLGRQRPDGGFGGVGRTITEMVHLEALGLAKSEAFALALGFLLARQEADGGWDERLEEVGPNAPPWEVPGDSNARAYLTAAATLELAAAGQRLDERAEVAVGRGLDYLLARRRPDGRFEGFWHTTWLALSAVAARRGPDDLVVEEGLAALISPALENWEASAIAWMLHSFRKGRMPADKPPLPSLARRLATLQQPDGSWSSEDGDAYAVFGTIEALRALRAAVKDLRGSGYGPGQR